MTIYPSARKAFARSSIEQIGALLTELQRHLQEPVNKRSIQRCRILLDDVIALVIEESEPSLSKPLEDRLTRREHEIALALSEGKSNATIAGELFISINTVRFHVRNTLRKLDAKNRSEAAALVLRWAVA
ncbi:helix-turn-helix domain-containing protein [Rhodococcus erythropolis]|uniref:helix-turn-helix domain-containing protein n=1 Tax=Rhodococcus erythropolis TaxID=1833 RepID=UPI002225BBAE|nr:LuxR C-terminal-related transcriptional regulator [Rhodococcus erythropolis]MCW2295398.1 DNA-binding NarL/FixJ family response regulator [Rhodococcus erythropolis]